MNRNRRRNVQQPHGCLGRMVNLFDFGTVGNGKKFLTNKPYFDDGSLKRNQLDLVEDKTDSIAVNGTPIKKLLEQEMSKELELTVGGSTNLVAKLMGLESFPHAQRSTNSSKPRLRRSLSHGECRDVYEIWEKPPGVEEGLVSKKKMDIVREKFLEAKRLVTDEKLRHSKEFQEAMEVLSENKELFIEFLKESNNFFSHHLHSFESMAPEKSKRITILKPSKTIDDEKLGIEEEYQTKKSTRIVVLKPNGLVTKASSCPTSPRGLPVESFEERDSKEVVVKEETSHSSVFSNGYIGDDSYDADSEIMSPVSRHSWDYINKYDSPFSSSPFTRASGSPESSSVCREAKKRLSERWALMAASNENVHNEAKVIEKKGGYISLGDMLALSDSMSDLRTGQGEASDGTGMSASCLPSNFSREEGNSKPSKSLMRSKSLPESSTSLGHKVPKELTKSKSLKWSLKGRVTNFLFSRNKKASNERSKEANPESLDSLCNDESVSTRSMVSREAGLSTCFPASVLETSDDEDDEIFFNSSVMMNRSSSSSLEPEMMMSNLLGKSPSIGRNFSFNDSTVARCYSSNTSIRDVEEDLRLLINTLLSAAHLDEETESDSSSIIDHLLSKWHSVESPLDPSLRDSYADSAEHQKLGSNVKKLVFDLVNTLLLELTPSYLGHGSHMLLLSGKKTLGSYVINRMQECLKGNGRVEYRWWDEDGDLSSLAVNRVVRSEVAEIGSKESLRLEMECMGEEIELKLLEELVEEVLMGFSEQDKL